MVLRSIPLAGGGRAVADKLSCLITLTSFKLQRLSGDRSQQEAVLRLKFNPFGEAEHARDPIRHSCLPNEAGEWVPEGSVSSVPFFPSFSIISLATSPASLEY